MPHQRVTGDEKAAIKEGQSAGEIWPDARWTVRHNKAKAGLDGRKPVDLAIPVFGYKTHISIDKKHGFISRQIVTDSAAHDGKRLRKDGLIDLGNTCRDVWDDTGYRSAENEKWLKEKNLNSRIHRKKRRDRPISADRERQRLVQIQHV